MAGNVCSRALMLRYRLQRDFAHLFSRDHFLLSITNSISRNFQDESRAKISKTEAFEILKSILDHLLDASAPEGKE